MHGDVNTKLIIPSFHTLALILVPTRELALQTAQVCKDLGKHLKVQVLTSTGGTNLQEEIMRFYETGVLAEVLSP